MANIGGEAAYLRLQKPDNNLSQTLQFWGGIAARRGEEDRARDERQEAVKKQELREWENKYGLKEADFQNKYTGFGSYDDMNRDYARFTTDRYLDISAS